MLLFDVGTPGRTPGDKKKKKSSAKAAPVNEMKFGRSANERDRFISRKKGKKEKVSDARKVASLSETPKMHQTMESFDCSTKIAPLV